MADVNANIGVNIDTSNALAQLKSLQRQISQFHSSISKSSEAAALAQRDLQRNFIGSVNSIGAFSAELRTVRTTSESFTNSLEKNKFSMREYFRYAGGATKTFGRLFKSEYDTIGKVAEDRVKKLQTQYIKMGRDATGAMKAIAITPQSLDLQNFSTQTQIAAQKQAIFNQLMKQGSTNLLNFGKNTQWAGRQLMVGFTLPLMAAGSAAAKSFMDMEAQALKFKKVYGDLFTPKEETQEALDNIVELGKQFTKYGVAVSATVGLAADAAAAGFSGLDLQRQTVEATRLSVLGQIDNQKALETTISLQNSFAMSSDKLADSINFLNAVENQTVVSLDDITTAIPKVAPVIQQLGGDVKDLAFFMTAMKEGGINASEGANALKSGLAALINPSSKAAGFLASMGINIDKIVEGNAGNVKQIVIDFANALNTLDPLNRARAIEQMFGKFQFARLSTLFQNVTKDGTQASRVLDLAGSSIEELSSLAEQELGVTANSAMNKFKKAVEDLKVAVIPVGQAFLEAVTPILEFLGNILEKFSNLSSGTKKAITLMVTVIGGLGPVLLMTFGLLANGVANIIKLFLTLRMGYQRLTGQSQMLAEQTQYMTNEQLEAAAAAHSLNQAHATLTQQFTSEAEAVRQLITAYQGAISAASRFASINPGMMVPPAKRQKFANNGIVRGPGGPKDDMVPIMASNGEAVIDAATVNANRPLIDELLATGTFKPKIDLNAGRSVRALSVGRFAPRPGGDVSIEEQRRRIAAANASTAPSVAPVSQPSSSVSEEFISTRVGRSASGGEKAQVNIPGGYQLGHFAEPIKMTGADLRALVEKESKGVKAAVENLISSVGGNLKTTFDVFTNQVTVQSKDLNQNLGEVGSGKTADVNMFRKESVDQAGAYNAPLIREMKKIGATPEEIQVAVKQLSDEFSSGIDSIVKGTTVTAEQVNEITKAAYDKVAAANDKVDQARKALEKPGAIKETTGVTSGRVSFAGGYNTSTVKKGINEVVQEQAQGLYPTQQAFNFTGDAARKVGIQNAKAIRLVFDQLGEESKARVFALVGDIDAMSKQVITEAQNSGIDIGKYAVRGVAKGAETESPSKATRKTGEDVGKGLEVGIKSREDEVAKAGESIGKVATRSTDRGARRVATRPQGSPEIDNMIDAGSPTTRRAATRPQGPANIPTGVLISKLQADMIAERKIAADLAKAQAKSAQDQIDQQERLTRAAEEETAKRQASAARMGKLNNTIQAGSFALMSLSGMAQMFGGNMGKMSEVVFKVSGALFALQTVTQLLTQAKALELIQTRLAVAKQAAAFATYGTGMGAKSGLMGALARFGIRLTAFLGPIGIATAAVSGLVVGFKLINDMNARSREKIEGLGNAAELTDAKLSALGNLFGVTPRKSAFDRAKTAKGPEVQVGSQQRTEVEKVKEDKGFQEAFAKDINALKAATDSQAKLIFDSLAIELKGQGYSSQQIQTIVTALQEEAGKTKIKFDFKQIDISTKEGQDRMAKNITDLTDRLSKNLSDGMTTVYRQIYDPKQKKWITQPFVELSNSAKKSLNLVTKSMKSMMSGLANQFETGIISADQFNNAFNNISNTIKAMPQPQAMMLLNNLLNALPDKLKSAAIQLQDVTNKMLLLKGAAAGVLPDEKVLEAMRVLETAQGPNAPFAIEAAKKVLAEYENNIKVTGEALRKLNAAAAAGNKTGPLGPDGKKLSAAAKLTIARLQKELDILKTKKDQINETNDALKRQYDYQQKLLDLQKSSVEAKISGDYIGAAMFDRQKSFETQQFNKESESITLDKKITQLENRISALQNNERVTRAEQKVLDSTKKRYAGGGLIKGPGTGTSDSIPATVVPGFAQGGMPIKVSDGEFIFSKKAIDNMGGAGVVDNLHQSARKGGKNGWLQKWAKSLTGQRGAEMFGTAALVRKFAGMGQKGDNLSAGLLPLNFLGMGGGSTNFMKVAGQAAGAASGQVAGKGSSFMAALGQQAGNISARMARIDKEALAKVGKNANQGWQEIQNARIEQLAKKYPDLDKLSVQRFNEIYAKEFYGLSAGESLSIFKGDVIDAATAKTTWDPSKNSYFSRVPDVAAAYSDMLRVAKPSQDKGGSILSSRIKISSLTNKLGEGIDHTSAQGMGEFPIKMTAENFQEIMQNLVSHTPDEFAQLQGFASTGKKMGKYALDPLLGYAKAFGFADGGIAKRYSIPSYDVGVDYVPKDTLAMVHKGERILTAEENRGFNGSTSSVNNTNNIYINGTDLNKKEIADEVMVRLDRVQKKNNKTNMVKY